MGSYRSTWLRHCTPSCPPTAYSAPSSTGTYLGPAVVLGVVPLDVVEALHAVLPAHGVQRAVQHGHVPWSSGCPWGRTARRGCGTARRPARPRRTARRPARARTLVQRLSLGSYRSTWLRHCTPSCPPTAYSAPSSTGTYLGPAVLLGVVPLDVVEALHAVLPAHGVQRAVQHGHVPWSSGCPWGRTARRG
ncbi:unnamed protein product [Parnassius apollo]|uniref:(apollo) hypothetical protein n=1 Tax=Parnassius apollo TaxID=110799 RepID=A0A8S3Y0D2_PARAO|nr:unnamed protein product [Parnassius apollo]